MDQEDQRRGPARGRRAALAILALLGLAAPSTLAAQSLGAGGSISGLPPGTLPPGVSGPEALRLLSRLRSGAAAGGVVAGQSLRAAIAGANIDSVGRPGTSDLTVYGGLGISTGSGDFTRGLGPADLTQVSPPITVPGATALGQSLGLGSAGSAPGPSSFSLSPSATARGLPGGGAAGAGGAAGGLGALIGGGGGAGALGLGGSGGGSPFGQPNR